MEHTFSLGNAEQTTTNGVSASWNAEIRSDELDMVVGEVHLADVNGNYNVVLDNALHQWVLTSGFETTISDPELLAALRIAHQERIAKVEPEALTWRFLHLRESGLRHPRFVLTQRMPD